MPNDPKPESVSGEALDDKTLETALTESAIILENYAHPDFVGRSMVIRLAQSLIAVNNAFRAMRQELAAANSLIAELEQQLAEEQKRSGVQIKPDRIIELEQSLANHKFVDDALVASDTKIAELEQQLAIQCKSNSRLALKTQQLDTRHVDDEQQSRCARERIAGLTKLLQEVLVRCVFTDTQITLRESIGAALAKEPSLEKEKP